MNLGDFGDPLRQNYATQEAVQSLYRQVKMSGTIFVLFGSLYSGLRGHQKLFFTTGHFVPTPGPEACQKSPAVTGLIVSSKGKHCLHLPTVGFKLGIKVELNSFQNPKLSVGKFTRMLTTSNFCFLQCSEETPTICDLLKKKNL